MNLSRISKILNKKIFNTILVIVVVSGFLGFLYNILQPNPLPLIFTPKHIEQVDDSLLFNQIEKTEGIEQNKEIDVSTTQIPKDTIKKVDSTIAKNELPKQTIDDSPPNISEEGSKELKSVNYEQMKKIVANPGFIIIDARRPEEYKKAHIPGAINIFALSDPNEKFELIMSIPLGKKYVVYCDGGNCDLSHQLAEEMLHSFGFTNVYIYEGGWEEWSKNK